MNNYYSLPCQVRPRFLSTVSLSWLLMMLATSAQVSGNIFRDYNGNGTDMPLVTAGASTGANINWGVSLPTDCCQASPRLVTARFVNGTANNTNSPITVVPSLNYLASGANLATATEFTKSAKNQAHSTAIVIPYQES